MKEILKKADECVNLTADDEVSASSGAEYPAMFLYVGDKAAEQRALIRKCLKQKLINGGSISHVVMRELSSARYDDADLCVEIGLPDDRGESLEYILGDDGRLARFNDAGELEILSGQRRTRCGGKDDDVVGISADEQMLLIYSDDFGLSAQRGAAGVCHAFFGEYPYPPFHIPFCGSRGGNRGNARLGCVLQGTRAYNRR